MFPVYVREYGQLANVAPDPTEWATFKDRPLCSSASNGSRAADGTIYNLQTRAVLVEDLGTVVV
jgi:hypothetical protein